MKILLLLIFPLHSFCQCELVEYSKDKFTDVEHWKTSSYFDLAKKAKAGEHIIISNNKVISPIIFFYSKDTFNYQASITLYGEQSSFKTEGLYFVFANGEKLQYPAQEIGRDYFGDRLTYLAILKLSKQEIELFKSQTVTDIRIAATDTNIEPWIGEKMKEQFNCLLSKVN